MSFVTQFVKAVVITQICAVGALLLAAWFMDNIYEDRSGDTFFSYRMRIFDGFPYWLVSVLVLMCAHGIWLFRVSMFDGDTVRLSQGVGGTHRGSIPVNPVRLAAVNLVAIPALLLLSVFVRQYGL